MIGFSGVRGVYRGYVNLIRKIIFNLIRLNTQIPAAIKFLIFCPRERLVSFGGLIAGAPLKPPIMIVFFDIRGVTEGVLN